jgi:hypothetical protein
LQRGKRESTGAGTLGMVGRRAKDERGVPRVRSRRRGGIERRQAPPLGGISAELPLRCHVRDDVVVDRDVLRCARPRARRPMHRCWGEGARFDGGTARTPRDGGAPPTVGLAGVYVSEERIWEGVSQIVRIRGSRRAKRMREKIRR